MSKETAKSIVERKFNELQEYAKNYNKISEENKKELMTKHRTDFQKDPESVDVVSIAREMFYMSGFYQTDIRKMQVQLLENHNMAIEMYPELEFSEDIKNTIAVLKNNLPKQIFVIESGEFVEVEEGKREELQEKFEEQNYFSYFEKQVKTLLNA